MALTRRHASGMNRREAALAITSLPATVHSQGDAPALIVAAERGDVAELRRLLDGGAAVNARDARGRNTLLAATQGGRVAAARR